MRLPKLSAKQLLYGYANGVFPMAEGKRGNIYWYSPDPRAIIPIDTYRPPRSLRPLLNKQTFEVRFNTCFEQVMRHCAVPRKDDEGTWISEEIIQAYTELHEWGFAHSVETYFEGELAGGLYGVALGAAFFGESMFYLRPNASKVAFHHLLMQLQQRGFELLDTQFTNSNVERYGAIEIPQAEYMERLEKALSRRISFLDGD
jgi:leucyl/phenylalanyl-tRNA---protein transferase